MLATVIFYFISFVGFDEIQDEDDDHCFNLFAKKTELFNLSKDF